MKSLMENFIFCAMLLIDVILSNKSRDFAKLDQHIFPIQ